MGESDELAKINKLPEIPNVLICDVLELPFEFWAEVNKMPELELTKEEAQRLGLPVTQLLEYFFPGKIPLIAWAFLNLAVTSKKIVFKRLKLVAAKKQGAGKAPPGGGSGPKPPTSQPPSAGSDMVKPATGFMKVTSG